MAVNAVISEEKENAAIDMNISMVVEDLAELLRRPEEEILTAFLQSKTCAELYQRQSKLWWDGPTAIAEYYLEEIRKNGGLQKKA